MSGLTIEEVSSASGHAPWRLRWPMPIKGGCATWIGDRVLLSGQTENPTKDVQGLLRKVAAVAQVSVKLHLRGTRAEPAVGWEIGPKPIGDEQALVAELRRVRNHKSFGEPLPDGTRQPWPVVLEAYPGITIAQIAATWDLVTEAGFEEVCCPAQEAWAMELRRRR